MSKENSEIQSKLPSRKSIPPFESLRALDAVGRFGGIRRAAQVLLRDHAVVSRHLRVIEDWVGCKLLERTPLGTVLTEQGKKYHEQICRAIDQISNATTELMKQNERNNLHIWCSPGFALHWLVKYQEEFEVLFPELNIELRSTHLEPDFTRYEADVDIRLVETPKTPFQSLPGVRCIELARPEVVPVASPEYLADNPLIESPLDLFEHKLLYEKDFDSWKLWFKQQGVDQELIPLGPRLWDGHMTAAAAKQGRGIALTNTIMLKDELKEVSLVDITKDNPNFNTVTLWSYQFFAREDSWDSDHITHFRHWLLKALASQKKW